MSDARNDLLDLAQTMRDATTTLNAIGGPWDLDYQTSAYGLAQQCGVQILTKVISPQAALDIWDTAIDSGESLEYCARAHGYPWKTL